MKTRILSAFLAFCLMLTLTPAVFAEDTATWEITDGVMTITGSGEIYSNDGPQPDDWPYSGEGITSIIIGEGITSIPNFAFEGFSELTHVYIPDTVEVIGYASFQDCTALTDVTMPFDIMVDYDAFTGTPWLRDLPNDNGFVIYNGVLLRYNGLDTAIVIPDTVTSIAGGFSDVQLESAIIPEGVAIISDYAFTRQASLTDVTLPAGLEYIGSYAFDQSGLTSIHIPDSVTYLGKGAFSYCKNLTTANVPDDLDFLGDDLFRECRSLTDVTLGKGLPGIPDQMFYYCTKLTTVTLPDSVTYIGEEAFGRCYSMTELTLPENVTRIGVYAFWDCWNLTALALPNNLEALGDSAFSGCSKLATLNIPDALNAASYSAFEDTPWLENQFDDSGFAIANGWFLAYNGTATALTIPDSVDHIAGGAFKAGNNFGAIRSIDLPQGLVYIGAAAFSGCSSLTSIDLPQGITSIKGSTFSDCSALTSVQIPDGVTSIGPRAFGGCTSLTGIHIPDSVTSIGNHAFYGCAFTSVTIPASVTDIGDLAFGYYEDDFYYEDRAISGFRISGYTNTAAQAYAKLHGFSFTALDGSDKPPVDEPPVDKPIFNDVPLTEWYAEPVEWAVECGITAGTGKDTFSPNDDCTRSQVVTFLWRAAGKPEPETTVNPFSDVKESDWFYKAVLWAVENEITVGIGGGKFGTEDTCTRAQVATFLWRTAGCPELSTSERPFTDLVETWYVTPVLWAYGQGITQGDGHPWTFNPDGECTRAQIVTFLYRFETN